MNLFIRTIGLERAETHIGLANLGYNMKRLVFWRKREAIAWPHSAPEGFPFEKSNG